MSCQVCPPTCQEVFGRLRISNLIQGCTQVSWDILPTFTDPLPWEFQLQVGTSSNNDADDWEDVGLPVTNSFTAIDGEQRVYGKSNWTHYRVKLNTSMGEYISDPELGMGTLSNRDWRIAREIIRKEKLIHRMGSQNGVILRRRVSGERCTECLDFQTKEIRKPTNCKECFGTGFRCGYFFPSGCFFANISPQSTHIERDSGQGRGTIEDTKVVARVIMTDEFIEEDIFVSLKLDQRYYVHSVQNLAEMRGVPIIGNIELRPIPYSSPVYQIDIPQQLALLTI